jgi:hypothetical protein
MGPDEHNAVREAIEAFSDTGGPPFLVHDLGDSRAAVMLRAVNARRAMVGVIMMVLDARVVKQDPRGGLKIMTPAAAGWSICDHAAGQRAARGCARAPRTPGSPWLTSRAPLPRPLSRASRRPSRLPLRLLAAAGAPPRQAARVTTCERDQGAGRTRRIASAGGNLSGNRPPACRPAPQSDSFACPASGPPDQGQPAQAL